MVKPDYPYKDGRGVEHINLIGHYSDLNLVIQKVGTEELYSYVVDTYPTTYEYVETNIPIPEPPIIPENSGVQI